MSTMCSSIQSPELTSFHSQTTREALDLCNLVIQRKTLLVHLYKFIDDDAKKANMKGISIILRGSSPNVIGAREMIRRTRIAFG